MTDSTNERKYQHLDLIISGKKIDRKRCYFDLIRLKHRALPQIDLENVDPSVEFMGNKLSFPLLISSMTGGDHQILKAINQNLAIAAEATGVAMGVGSQRVMFTHPGARSSFDIRSFAPSALLFANLGAVQLNYGFTIDHCREAIKILEADGLFFHFNALQEAVQPEGDTNFSNLAIKMGEIARALEEPVMVKEVGAGMSAEDAALLIEQDIHYIDVAGSGGTSWSRIEHFRRCEEDRDGVGILFQDWGNPTPLALLKLKTLRDKVTLIASGGVRSGIDMAKAVILGARLVGIASPFLKPAMESPDKVIKVIERIKREFTTTMFLLGVQSFDQLFGNETLAHFIPTEAHYL